MKKVIFRIMCGVALAALMIYNVQISQSKTGDELTLVTIKNSAIAASVDGPLCSNGQGSYCCKNSDMSSCAATEGGSCQ